MDIKTFGQKHDEKVHVIIKINPLYSAKSDRNKLLKNAVKISKNSQIFNA